MNWSKWRPQAPTKEEAGSWEGGTAGSAPVVTIVRTSLEQTIQGWCKIILVSNYLVLLWLRQYWGGIQFHSGQQKANQTHSILSIHHQPKGTLKNPMHILQSQAKFIQHLVLNKSHVQTLQRIIRILKVTHTFTNILKKKKRKKEIRK